ncbi:hypothetical protein [Ekhidna sp.]|uniref:hypothetical protein n=1 Tax=Ekhidna sp. TaxID=2608089 RepID=UPI0032972429
MIRFKVQIILIMLANYFFAIGQVKANRNYEISDDIIVLVIRKMQQVETLRQVDSKRNSAYETTNNFIGIKHKPSADFNIYLRLAHQLTSGIRTGIEVSLNYAGVVNFTSQISLRKREERM